MTGRQRQVRSCWWEVSRSSIAFDAPVARCAAASRCRGSRTTRVASSDGGAGNLEHVVNWENDGHEIQRLGRRPMSSRSRQRTSTYYLQDGHLPGRIVVTGRSVVPACPAGFTCSTAAAGAVPGERTTAVLCLALLNSVGCDELLAGV